MTDPSLTELLARALELPPADRLTIANQLLDSVEERDDEAWDDAWLAELDRRAAEIEQGTAQLEDWETVKARLKRALRSK